jgi:hypothetical protein
VLPIYPLQCIMFSLDDAPLVARPAPRDFQRHKVIPEKRAGVRESSSAAETRGQILRRKIDQFDDIVSQEAKLIIGTAPGEMVTERERIRFGFETEGSVAARL